MLETRTTSDTHQRNARATAAVAFHAIAAHMLDHGLPVPSFVTTPAGHDPHLTLWILQPQLEGWMRSGVRLGTQVVREVTGDTDQVRVTTDCDVDAGIGTVSFRLSWLEEKNLHLRVVTA